MKKHTRILFETSPLLIIFLALFITGIIFTLLQSLHIIGLSQGKLSLDAYVSLFDTPRFTFSLVYSFFIALVSSLIAVCLGIILAAGIWRLPVHLRAWSIVYKIPLILPHISIAFITILFLGKTGILSRVSYSLGMIDTFRAFPNILYSGKGFGIITAYVIKETPFVILMVLGILVKLSETQIQTARMLGASSRKIFTTIVFPHIYPVVRMSFIIIFLYSLGAFDIPYVMSESQPEMISVSVYNTFFKKDLVHRPEAAAALVILFIISLVVLVIFFKQGRKQHEV